MRNQQLFYPLGYPVTMNLINCPNCEFAQAPSRLECIKCGIVFEKYRLRQARIQSAGQRSEPGAGMSQGFFRGMLIKTIPRLKKYSQHPDNEHPSISEQGTTRLRRFGKSGSDYAAQIVDAFLYAVIYCIATILVYGLVFILLRMSWNGYTATHMGERFLQMSPVLANTISGIFGGGLFLIVQITLAVFVICLVFAIILQFLSVARLLFYKNNLIRNLVCLGLPLIFVSGYYLTTIHHFSLETGCALSALPVIFLFHFCFDISYRFIPEIGEISRSIKKGLRFLKRDSLPVLKEKLQKIVDRINAS